MLIPESSYRLSELQGFVYPEASRRPSAATFRGLDVLAHCAGGSAQQAVMLSVVPGTAAQLSAKRFQGPRSPGMPSIRLR